jgi:hypothetical protein
MWAWVQVMHRWSFRRARLRSGGTLPWIAQACMPSSALTRLKQQQVSRLLF